MRDIIFKAKRKDNGEWVEGTVVRHPYRENCYYILADGVFAEDDYCIVPVDPDTVCEYTGLKDINGKRIYEGDIILFAGYSRSASLVVEMSDFEWVAKRGDLYRHRLETVDKIEVIGNRFDNPELLNP